MLKYCGSQKQRGVLQYAPSEAERRPGDARPLTRSLQSESWTRSKGNSQEGNTFEGIIFEGTRSTRPREKTKQLQKKAKPIKSGPAFPKS